MCTIICATPRSWYVVLAEGVGFEPTGDIMPSTVFKTVALNRSATPPWSRCGDLNPKPTDYKSVALPIEPHRHIPGERELSPGTFKGGYAIIPNSNTRLYTPSKGSFSWIRHERGRIPNQFHTAAKEIDATATFILPHAQNPFSVFAKNYGRSDSGHNLSSSFMMLSFEG